MEKVRVFYDYQTFHIQRFGGISKYFCEIISRMHGVNACVSVAFSMNKYLSALKNVRYIPVPCRVFKLLEGMFRIMNRNVSLMSLRKGEFDVFHPTYYSPYFLDELNGKPFVLTIHDMTHELYPQYFSETDTTVANKKLLAEKADRIIAISENTKRDIIDILHIDESKIDVIYHGFQPRKLSDVVVPGLPARYVLYVGERRTYKNFNVLLEAFTKLHDEMPDMYLVVTGRPIAKTERTLFLKCGVDNNVLCYSDVSDEMLDCLYRNATMFVYPSLYEGFGIPILEAFAQHCPVILSNASCFPEIGGDACAYFNPLSADSLLDCMKRVLTDKDYSDNLVCLGTERLQKFDWQKTALQTEDTYRKVLELRR